MSVAQYKSGSKVNNTTYKPKASFCNACFKAGKEESLYTNHFPKSVPGPKGVIVCPTILSAICSYCGKAGHWANDKYCSAIKNDMKKNEKKVYVTPLNSYIPAKKQEFKGGFAVLIHDDSDDDSDVKIINITKTRPAIVKPVMVSLPIAGASWASIASTPIKLVPYESKKEVIAKRKPEYTTNWADSESSSEEEEQEQEQEEDDDYDW